MGQKFFSMLQKVCSAQAFKGRKFFGDFGVWKNRSICSVLGRNYSEKSVLILQIFAIHSIGLFNISTNFFGHPNHILIGFKNPTQLG